MRFSPVSVYRAVGDYDNGCENFGCDWHEGSTVLYSRFTVIHFDQMYVFSYFTRILPERLNLYLILHQYIARLLFLFK